MQVRQLLLCIVLSFSQASIAAENSKYLVFVGEKISVTPVPEAPEAPEDAVEIRMDAEFLAKYRIVEQYRGTYDGTQIEFTAFDHYGTPPFSEYKNVLMYVVLHDGRYYHAKYQFNPLYKTKDGRWAAPYSTYDYRHEFNKGTRIKPEIIEFAEPVVMDVTDLPKEQIEKWYPKPYFRVESGKATAVYGNYVPELFLLKQGGVLKARGDFQ